MSSLRELKLANNKLSGPLDRSLPALAALEILDMHGNEITSLPAAFDAMTRLRILNLNENQLQRLPFDELSKFPLIELSVRKNRLAGALVDGSIKALPYLQSLDASANQLTHVVPVGSHISLPAAHTVSLSMNRLQCLPDMSTWTSLLTLRVDENHIASLPDSFPSLQKLRHADLSSNDIRTLPPEIARMQSLSTLRLSGNPMRDRKLVSASTDELKEILNARLEPPPPYREYGNADVPAKAFEPGMTANVKSRHVSGPPLLEAADDDAHSDFEEDFTTPPTSAPQTPVRQRPRSDTVVLDKWYVQPGGVFDLSNCEISTLNSERCSLIASRDQVRQMQLGHNPLTSVPLALTVFASTLTSLSLAHMQLSGEDYLTGSLELPALREMSISSNRITSLAPLTRLLCAPVLEKLDVSLNCVLEVPLGLRQCFPLLSALLAANNQLTELKAECIRGLRTVDASSNAIAHLDPHIGLLGGAGGLQRLDVSGNRFKVPRWSVLERGTEATLRWLRGRLPDEEMEAWREANGETSGGESG